MTHADLQSPLARKQLHPPQATHLGSMYGLGHPMHPAHIWNTLGKSVLKLLNKYVY